MQSCTQNAAHLPPPHRTRAPRLDDCGGRARGHAAASAAAAPPWRSRGAQPSDFSSGGAAVTGDVHEWVLSTGGALAAAKAMTTKACGRTLRLAATGDIDTTITRRARAAMREHALSTALRAALGRLRGSARELLRLPPSSEQEALTKLMKLGGAGACHTCAFCTTGSRETRAHWRFECTGSAAAPRSTVASCFHCRRRPRRNPKVRGKLLDLDLDDRELERAPGHRQAHPGVHHRRARPSAEVEGAAVGSAVGAGTGRRDMSFVPRAARGVRCRSRLVGRPRG